MKPNEVRILIYQIGIWFTDQLPVKICEKPSNIISSYTLTDRSHDLGFCLRTYQPCHFHIWNESSTAESERANYLVFPRDCSSIFACHRISVVLP